MELWELIARECCRDTLARYTHGGDRFRLDDYVGAFCEDGVLEIRDAEPLRGRAAIYERFRGGLLQKDLPADGEVRATSAPAVRPIVRHNVANVRFESVSPDEAVVASYFTVFTHIGLDHMGRYRDRMVPVGDEWLIAHRFVSTDWRSAESVFGMGGR